MLDDDMVIDCRDEGREAYSFLEKLIAHDKDICGVLYYQRGQECEPVLMKRLNEKGYRFLHDDEILHALQEADVAGGGCLLIKTKVFDRIPFPYFSPEHQYGTDVQLCRQAQEKGFTVWADTSIELGHIRNEKTIVTSRNRHQFQDAAAQQGNAGIKRTFIASELYESLIQDAAEYTGLARELLFGNESGFMAMRKESALSDADWYREFPVDRVRRQVWFNTEGSQKKHMTQFVLSMIPHAPPRRILDFGCGIGITAFALAEKGHQVTAMDIRGTGTLEFLKWRISKYNAPMTILESEGGVPKINGLFDAIIATDCLEHIAEWKQTVHALAEHLTPGGVLFANNAAMYDMTQPEHYDVHPVEFIKTCVDAGLLPQTQISYLKTEVPVYA